jgi:hypothetical protein
VRSHLCIIPNPDPGTSQASATDRNATGSGIAQARWLEIISLNDRVVPENLSFISSYGIVGLCRSRHRSISNFIVSCFSSHVAHGMTVFC